MDFKELEFAREESEESRWNPIDWLGWYIYLDIYKILFYEFPIMLHEWLSKLETQQKIFQGGELKEWTSFLSERLKIIDNPISRVVDLWVDNIIEGYITEFVVDTITSYSEAERKFFQGPLGWYISSWKAWIKMLVCEKGILRMIDWETRVAMLQQNPGVRCSEEKVELN